jgi:transposase
MLMTEDELMSKRRVFSRDYKLAAVRKVLEQGLSYSQVARDLGITDNLIHNWKKAFEADGTLASQLLNSSSMDAELKRLREENRQLRMEKDVLKKAAAFFARESI